MFNLFKRSNRATIFGLSAAVAASALFLAPSTHAQSTMTETERAAFGAEVRAYLLENPEVIVEAMDVLEKRMLATAVAQLEQDVSQGNFEAEAGASDGKLLLVEFTDYDCPWCRRVRPEVDAFLRSDGDVRYVVRVLPRVGSDLPERAAVAATLQDRAKAAELHMAMMAYEGRLEMPAIETLASTAGLDVEKLKADMGSPAVETRLAGNDAAARRLNIQGTPGFVMGSEVIPGAVPAEELARVAAEVRAAQ